MIIVAMTRIIGAIKPSLRHSHDFDTAWELFWQHLEACIAVSMGYITAFRGIFADKGPSPAQNGEGEVSGFRRWLIKLKISRRSSASSHSWRKGESRMIRDRNMRIQQDSITHATLRGLRTFIKRYNRGPGNTTITLDSGTDPLQEYHEYQRQRDREMHNVMALEDWTSTTSNTKATDSDKVGYLTTRLAPLSALH
jgi:hypothetical protein